MLGRRLLLIISPLLFATTLRAQGAPADKGTQYWLTAGAGPAWTWDDDAFPAHDFGSGLAASLTLQHNTLVTSLRGTRSHSDLGTIWDVGFLAGVGTSPVPSFRGSVAVGLGIAGTPHRAANLAFPLEIQFGWRLSPTIGLGSYLYGSYRASELVLGAAFGVVVGRLR